MMKKSAYVMGLLASTLVACGGTADDTGISADAVVLDVRCDADADCPTGFECETELENGVDTSFCVSHDEDAAAAGACPDGYELEEEHAGTFCKPHGGTGSSSSGSSGGGDDGGGHG